MLIGQQVLILGAGIGGLATAIALARHGAAVRIVEQAAEITEVGAGLQISPNGIAVLDALGLGDEARSLAIRATAVTLRDYRRGAPVLRLDLARHAADQSYLLFHRADLIDLLDRAALAAGVTVQLGRQVTDVTDDATAVAVAFADGAEETAPLVIGADGLQSRLRPILNGPGNPFFTGQVAWRALVPASGAPASEVAVFMGPGRHLIRYPLRAGTLTNIVAVEERSEWASEDWQQPGDPDQMRRAFAGFSPEVRALLGQVDKVSLWGLLRHPVAACWFGKHSALVGDAAHPTLPFLAQGANMALEDAWVLADCLAKMPLTQALPAYQSRRKDRVTRVIAAANANARNYHLRNPAARLAAHGLLRLGGSLAPAKVVGQFDWIYRHDVTKA